MSVTSKEVLLTQTLCLMMNISCCSGWNVTYWLPSAERGLEGME
eukprot:CAMPEP_0174940350 /NCGR_PEP_ID=MMETSP1355-20121228/68870_1 /TAXON_ID=464990 /ORGANISM="Hemiselmis tepida, Strain CCMP443" /LENGTH=43 /DNA_ID= /DNA_START= /DNA_END= /DNA_ORIENTATION=